MPATIKEKILREGKKGGYVTIQFLNDVIPEDKDAAFIDDIFEFLSKENIEVIAQELYKPDIYELAESSKIWLPNVEKEMLEYFQRNPDQMHNLSSRKFEELIAAVFRNQGFNVELTPPVKDGGFDFIAIQNDTFTGNNKYLVECKKYARENSVGVGIVRSLFGIVNDQKATKGIIATTSFFTKGAWDLCERHENQLSLSDYDTINNWLETLTFD